MLIESENLISRIDKCYQESAKTGLGLEPVMAIRDIKALISVMPAVDAAPVVHGRWIVKKAGGQNYPFWDTYCSECGYMSMVFKGWKYCPNCGAKMDLEEQHE